MIEYLIKRQKIDNTGATFNIVTLSRGYGRRSRGFREATFADTAATIGDEPLQLYRKFGRQVRVFVGERRAAAIQTIQARYPLTKQVLLDDAFQHRAVRPHLNILLMDYNRPFYTDHPFPAGRLRERRHGARRAHGVVVTKCPPDLSPAEQQRIVGSIRRFTRPDIPIFFGAVQYDRPVSFATGQAVNGLEDVVLVSGLANADPLEHYVSQTVSMRAHHRFPDHRAYTRADLDAILPSLTPGVSLLTTEKDWVKLDALLTPDERNTLPLYYLPIQFTFLGEDETTFGQFLTEATLKFR